MSELFVGDTEVAIAQGAAIHSGIKKGIFKKLPPLQGVIMLNSLQQTLGVNTTVTRNVINIPASVKTKHLLFQRQEMSAILPVATRLPFTAKSSYTPLKDSQTSIAFYVLGGENIVARFVFSSKCNL